MTRGSTAAFPSRGSTVLGALKDTVIYGRDGLGTSIVFSAGNGNLDGENVNDKAFQNSPYTIAVGALTSYGDVAYFSTPGAAVLVSAPGRSIATTDQTGEEGYNYFDDFTSSISGTSFSAPIVSGIGNAPIF